MKLLEEEYILFKKWREEQLFFPTGETFGEYLEKWKGIDN
jgi:hypothetical protein